MILPYVAVEKHIEGWQTCAQQYIKALWEVLETLIQWARCTGSRKGQCGVEAFFFLLKAKGQIGGCLVPTILILKAMQLNLRMWIQSRVLHVVGFKIILPWDISTTWWRYTYSPKVFVCDSKLWLIACPLSKIRCVQGMALRSPQSMGVTDLYRPAPELICHSDLASTPQVLPAGNDKIHTKPT